MKDIEILNEHKKNDTAVLTKIQVEILQDMAAGLTTKEITAKRGITEKTLGAHKYNIVKRTGAKKILQVILALYKKGIIV